MKSKDVSSDQDEVQKALALKRLEQPPPKFFQGFSHEVIDRLHTEEPEPPRNLRERLGLGEDWKPVMLCGLGVAACLVLGVSLMASLWVEKPVEQMGGGTDDPADAVLSQTLETNTAEEAFPGFQTIKGSEENNLGTVPVVVREPNTASAPKPE